MRGARSTDESAGPPESDRTTPPSSGTSACRRVDRDDSSAVFKFGETLINLLETGEAPSLVAPAPVAAPDRGVRFQFTLAVDDVDAMADELKRRGVELLNGPMDRPWGIRTASFRDPGGHIWEIAC